MHRHKCDICSFIWQHGEECAGIKSAHRCPICGTEQFWKYHGEEKASLTARTCHNPKRFLKEMQNV